VEDIEEIYINDAIASLSSDGYDNGDRAGPGWVRSPRQWSEDDDPTKHEMRIFYHKGNQTSTATPFANSSSFGINSFFNQDPDVMTAPGQTFIGKEIACLFIRYTFEPDVYDEGFPIVTARIKGKKVYDPRTGQTVFSNNAALCIRDFLTSAYGLNDSDIDDVSFSAAANICDEQIALAATQPAWTTATAYSEESVSPLSIFSLYTTIIPADLVSHNGVNYECILDHTSSASTEPGVGAEWETYWKIASIGIRYTIDGVVRADQAYGDVLQEMMTACGGTLFWGGGKWQLKVGAYTSPVKTLTLDDLRSDISMQTRVNLRDQFNRVQGTFVDADQGYVAADYPPVISEGSGSFTEQDNGVPQALNLDLPFTTNPATAQRLAKLTLFRGREQIAFTADFGLNAFDVEVGDIIALDFSYVRDGVTVNRYGWDNKEFEVLGWRFSADEEAGDLRITLTLRETSEAAFDWDAEESAIISNDTNLDVQPDLVTGLAVTASGVVNADGTFANSMAASWDFNDGATGYVVEYRENTLDYSSGRVEEADAVTDREQLVYSMYVNVLYRQPAQAGFDYYVSGGGSSLSAEELLETFSNSIEKQTNTFSGTVVSSRTNSVELAPVKDNALYDIRVRAVSVLGRNGPWTATTFSTAPDATVPSAPANLAVNFSSYRGVELTWDAVTTNTDASDLKDLFLYEVYRGESSDPTTLIARVSGPEFADVTVNDKTTYYYRVKARDFSGNSSAYSSNVSVTTALLDGITLIEGEKGLSVPPLGVDEINLAPNLELNAYALRPIFSALGSNSPTSSASLTAGQRYIISDVGDATTPWSSIDKTSNAVNGGTYAVGDEILATGSTTSGTAGACYPGRKELIPGDNIEFIQAYYHEATLNYVVYQNHYGGAWGVWPRQTSQSEYNLNSGNIYEIIYDDGTLDAIEQSVYDSYSEFLLREPEKSYAVTAQDEIDFPSGPPEGTLVNYWDYRRRYAGISEIEMRSQHRGSQEYDDSWTTLTKDYVNNRISNVPQNAISGSLPIEITGGSFIAGAIVSGDSYVLMKVRSGGSMTAVGVAAEDYRVGHEFTATAAGSALGTTDQDENRVGRIFTTDEMVLGNFYMVYDPSEDSADVTALQALGAETGKRNEVFRATSTTASDLNFKLLLCKLERVSLQWAGRTDNGTDGINNVTGAVSVKGLKK
jgi:hypothetical protein